MIHIVTVLRFSLGDCTINGISSKEDTLYLWDGEGEYPDLDHVRRPRLLTLVRRMIAGREYLHAEPMEAPPPGRTPWMAGGNYIHTSDSRFANLVCQYPIAVHDRAETWELYNSMD